MDESSKKIYVLKGLGRSTNHLALGILLRSIGLTIGKKNQNSFLLLKFQSDSMERNDQDDYAIEALSRAFPELINIVKVRVRDFSKSEEIKNKSIISATAGWEFAKNAIINSLFSTIIIEGFGEILSLDIFDKKEIIDVISQKQSNIDLILTGEKFPSYVSELAFSYSEFVDKREKNKAYSNKRIANGVEIITGEAKGKSLSALGKAIHVLGKGISQDKSHRVLILQWLKGGYGYTEDAAIEALRESYPHLVDHLRSGRDAIVLRGRQQPIDYVEAERMWTIAKAAIFSGLYKTIILDELNPIVDLELLPVKPINKTLLKKPANTEVLITGRCKNEPSYVDIASEHYYIIGHTKN